MPVETRLVSPYDQRFHTVTGPEIHHGRFFTVRSSSGNVLAVELHTHSEASYDGRDSVELLLEQAKAIGLDALAVTDHDEISASLDTVELAPEYDLIGIPGMEVSSADGHVLSLGLDELVPAGMPFTETVEYICERGGLAVVPHPYQESRSGVLANVTAEELTIADAIEVYNSRLITGYSNRQARRFARKHSIPMTAGSDAHVCEMVGQSVTWVDADEPTVSGILDAIRDGRTDITGKRTPWRVSLRQAAGGVRRRIRHRFGIDSDQKRVGSSDSD